jgi:hypothetical protein
MRRTQVCASALVAAWGMCAGGACFAAPAFERVSPQLFLAPQALVVTWADFDGDDDLDLLATHRTGELRLYRNDRGHLEPLDAAAAGLSIGGSQGRAAAWGDFDRDGDLDLYIGTQVLPVRTRNFLFRNEGSGRFTEMARELGVDMPGASSRQVAWIDFDNDADLDLFVADRNMPNKLFRNDGERFEDVTEAMDFLDPRRAVGACWFDFDEDGDLDVFIAHQEGDRDALYRNDGIRFTDVAEERIDHQPVKTLREGSCGCAAGDYDNDGDLDLFVSSYGYNLLYNNYGKGRFVEVAKALGIVERGQYVGASWADHDHDGFLDLFVAGYSSPPGYPAGLGEPHDHLFRYDGRRFVDVLPRDHPLNSADHGVQWADFDLDGDLDVALTDSRPTGGHPVLRNTLAEGARRRSLRVTVTDREGLQTRAGAEVRLYDARGDILGTRLVNPADGYDSQSVQPVHFGLAHPGKVSVEVTFMGREGRRTRRMTDVDPRKWQERALTVREGA